MINAIEISPHEPGTVYLAVTGYKLNDFSPYIYKTTDYGNRWRRIDEGLPENTFVRVVREDPNRERLILTGASRRRVFGEYQSTTPSRFAPTVW